VCFGWLDTVSVHSLEGFCERSSIVQDGSGYPDDVAARASHFVVEFIPGAEAAVATTAGTEGRGPGGIAAMRFRDAVVQDEHGELLSGESDRLPRHRPQDDVAESVGLHDLEDHPGMVLQEPAPGDVLQDH